MQTTEQTTQNNLPLRLWSVEEYHYMIEVGILKSNEPVELVAGQIINKMSP